MGDCCNMAKGKFPNVKRVMTCGKKKRAIAVAICRETAVRNGRSMVKVDGRPAAFIQPEGLRAKVLEPFLIIGKQGNLDIRVKTRGGGAVAQLYAARQAIAKSVIAYVQKYHDESTKMEMKDQLLQYDRQLLLLTQEELNPRSLEVMVQE